MELGKGWQSDKEGPYGKADPPNSKVLLPLQDPELAMWWVPVLQLCLGSESLRETPCFCFNQRKVIPTSKQGSSSPEKELPTTCSRQRLPPKKRVTPPSFSSSAPSGTQPAPVLQMTAPCPQQSHRHTCPARSQPPSHPTTPSQIPAAVVAMVTASPPHSHPLHINKLQPGDGELLAEAGLCRASSFPTPLTSG